MRRRFVAVLLCLAAVLALAGPAAAANDTSTQRARQEIAKASDFVDQALTAVKRGDRKEAYRLARSAYLDHFEYVEIPLRLRNPNLTLDTEFSSPSCATASATATRSGRSAGRPPTCAPGWPPSTASSPRRGSPRRRSRSASRS
jgi:hypothetical protein